MKPFDIYFSDSVGNNRNCYYGRKLTVRNKAELEKAVSFDYVCAKYLYDRRSKQNFISSDVVAMDCDNEKTEDPEEWLTPEKIREIFPGVMFCVHYSRNNNKPKGGLSPRPRFHVLFPIERISDSGEYESIKRQIAALVPEFDENAVDSARFFFGTKKPDVRCFEGSRLVTDHLKPRITSSAEPPRQRGITHTGSVIPKGQRNSSMYSAACRILRIQGNTNKALNDWSRLSENCVPPLPEDELRQIWRNALNFIQASGPQTEPCAQHIRPRSSQIQEESAAERPTFIELRGNRETINEGLLTRYFRENNRLLIVQHFNTVCYYLYHEEKGVYVRQSEVDLQRRIDEIITSYDPALLKHNLAKSVVGNLKAGKTVNENELNADESLMNFSNGILNVDTMELSSHSPSIYSTRQIPCNWTGRQAPTPHFDSYLGNLTNGDEKLEKLLLQWLGLIFSSADGSRIKKSLLLYGKGNTGKSIFYKLTERIVGEEYCAGIRLADFQERFGLAEMYGKRLIGDPEVDTGVIRNNTVIKSIIGGDPIAIEQKGRDRFTTLYRGFAVFCGNELPRFGGDRGKHFYDRFIIVHCENAIPEAKRDVYLLDKMYEEREGIVFKAVTAYKELKENNHRFTEPEHCKREMLNFKRMNSPAAAFVKECCIPWKRSDIKPGDYGNRRKNVFRVFEEWEKENFLFTMPYTEPQFINEVADYLGCEKEDLKIHKSDGNYYPFRLSTDTAKEYSTVKTFDYCVTSD